MDICMYCGKPDPHFEVGDYKGHFAGKAHKDCYEKEWANTIKEIEGDYLAGRTDWHIVNGKVERRHNSPDTSRPSVQDIIVNYLESHGYDGLFCEDIPCGCGKEDMCPCESDMRNCVPAYKVKCLGEACESPCDMVGIAGAFCYTTTKPEAAK